MGGQEAKSLVGAHGLELIKGDGFAEGDGDALAKEVGGTSMAGPGVEAAFDGGGDNGDAAAAEEEPGAAFEVMERAVWRARAFGKDDNDATGFELGDGGADGGGIALVFLDWNCAKAAEKRTEDRVLEEPRAGDGGHVAVADSYAQQRRIQMRLVVGDDEDAASRWDIGDAVKSCPVQERREDEHDPVPEPVEQDLSQGLGRVERLQHDAQESVESRGSGGAWEG